MELSDSRRQRKFLHFGLLIYKLVDLIQFFFFATAAPSPLWLLFVLMKNDDTLAFIVFVLFDLR